MTDRDAPPSELGVDPRPRQLLEKYTSLSGSLLLEIGEGLLEFEVPLVDRDQWGPAPVVRIGLTPEALDEEPEAELLTLGSPLFEKLIAAIRTRGFHENRGLVPPTETPSPGAAELSIRVEGATSEAVGADLSLLPVGRLLARISIKAGPRVEERLVESAPLDLSSGRVLPPSLATLLDHVQASSTVSMPSGVVATKPRPMDELFPLLFGQLEAQLADTIHKLRAEGERSLKEEVDRLVRYYEALLEDVEDADKPEDASSARKAIKAELARRKGEEEERWRLRATVHPLQLTQWHILGQLATWRLATPRGRTAALQATRLLSGETAWQLSCPGCGAVPEAVRVCRAGHASCLECSRECAVCGEGVCRTHGLATCASGPHPVCPDHSRTCESCGAMHCTQHSQHCAAADHEVCPSCSVLCARCGNELCQEHATHTRPDAPRGARSLCSACTVLCEGGTNEPVGLDEAVRCSTCERYICETHTVSCAVDGRPHCSRHLRRSDHSGRLLCESHRRECDDEPGSVLASDEVAGCATCGRAICDTHGGACDADGVRHCVRHLSPLADRPKARGCEVHRTVCHVDNVVYSIEGTKPCAVCEKPTCDRHRKACKYCARQVCARDIRDGRCLTCGNLREAADPPDDLVHAALAANGGEPLKAGVWHTARDVTSTVVQVDLGWTRRLVFTVPHGDTKPRTVLRHSAVGSRRIR